MTYFEIHDCGFNPSQGSYLVVSTLYKVLTSWFPPFTKSLPHGFHPSQGPYLVVSTLHKVLTSWFPPFTRSLPRGFHPSQGPYLMVSTLHKVLTSCSTSWLKWDPLYMLPEQSPGTARDGPSMLTWGMRWMCMLSSNFLQSGWDTAYPAHSKVGRLVGWLVV